MKTSLGKHLKEEMAQIIQICRLKGMALLKGLTFAFLFLGCSLTNAVLANSGSYIAGQFAEKERDFRNASYYYIDLISRGETERKIIKRSIIYSALSGNFEVATAISRKINDLELNYPVANLIIFAEAIKNRENSKISESFERHKKNFPNIFPKKFQKFSFGGQFGSIHGGVFSLGSVFNILYWGYVSYFYLVLRMPE